MRIYSILVLFCLISVNVGAVDVYVSDINTKKSLENVTLNVINPSGNYLNSSTTDVNGLSSFWMNETNLYYNITYEKFGYHTKYTSYSNDTDIINEVLYPISDDGMVNVNFGDKLFNPSRKFCVYYESNNRLDGCYTVDGNESITLLVNQNYYIVPQTETIDTFTSLKNMKDNLPFFAFMLTIFFLLIIGFVLIIKQVWKGSSKQVWRGSSRSSRRRKR